MATPTANTHRLGTIYIPAEHAEQLEALATQDGRSMNDHVRDAIKRYLARRKA